MLSAVRLLIVAAVLLLLARSARFAWRNRRVAVEVWRRIRPRHVLGSLALLACVLGTAAALLWLVPVTGFGAGSVLGLTGNAVFAPLEEVALRGGGQPSLAAGAEPSGGAAARGGAEAGGHPLEASGVPPRPRAWVMVATVAFLAGLLALLPWLAYVEERMFREGLERATRTQELWTALRFGLVHLVMLIPVAAALAIAVAGFAYGRVYRRAYRLAAAQTTTVIDPLGRPAPQHPPAARCRREAVLESTVWHTTFNSLVVLLVLTGFALQWALGA